MWDKVGGHGQAAVKVRSSLSWDQSQVGSGWLRAIFAGAGGFTSHGEMMLCLQALLLSSEIARKTLMHYKV